MSHPSYGRFTEIPSTVVQAWKDPEHYSMLCDLSTAHGHLLWSGQHEIPAIGEACPCLIGDIGPVEITGYFCEYGYFGVLAKALNPPEWLVKQNPEGEPTHLFGVDLGERNVAERHTEEN